MLEGYSATLPPRQTQKYMVETRLHYRAEQGMLCFSDQDGEKKPWTQHIKLNNEEKARYLQKIAEIDGLDPYAHTDWQVDAYNVLPPLDRLHLMAYLIEGTSYYTLNSRCEKSLQAHV